MAGKPPSNNGGNNQGGNNNPPKKNPPKKGGKGNRLEGRARRNVNVSFQPGLNSAYRGLDQANLDFQNQDLGVQSIYGGLPKEFSKLNTEYENRTSDISGDLQAGLAQFSGALNQQGLPASEVAANTSVYGTQGNNFQNRLASNDQRALQWNQSGEREGNLSERYARQNLSQDLSDTQQGYYNRIADIQDQKQPAIMAEMDQLRAERQSNQQDKAYADMIASLTGNALSSGGPPRRNVPQDNGNGNGQNNGQNGPGTVSWANIDNSGSNPPPPDTSGGNPNTGPADQPQTQLAQDIQNRVGNIRQAVDYEDTPQWLRNLYNYTPEQTPRWGELELGNYSPFQKQVFRRTRRKMEGLQEGNLY